MVQAPEKLRTIFNRDNLLVYGFLDSTATAGDVTFKGSGSSGEVSFSVNINPKVNQFLQRCADSLRTLRMGV